MKEPDTGIVNFYQMKDTLMGHVDRAELVEPNPSSIDVRGADGPGWILLDLLFRSRQPIDLLYV